MSEELVNVRYMVDDVEEAVAFYTTHLGFTLRLNAAPAFADVVRGSLRLLLSGPASSAGRPMPDGRRPQPGGWNRIHLIVEDIAGEVERLRLADLRFRNDIVSGPGGQQILLDWGSFCARGGASGASASAAHQRTSRCCATCA